METELTIQQVAQRSGLSVHTLRYYERNGLLEPVNRASNGHRRYSELDVQRIEFLTKLRATGMPIRQMQQFAELYRAGDQTIAQRRSLLESHHDAVKSQIDELMHHLSMIEFKIQRYKQLEQELLGEHSQQHTSERSLQPISEHSPQHTSEHSPQHISKHSLQHKEEQQ